MERHVNTYIGGMDQDSSLNKFDMKHYFEAWNLSPLSDKGLANGAMNSIMGTTSRGPADLPYQAVQFLIGHCQIRNWLVLIVTQSEEEEPSATGWDYIYRIDMSSGWNATEVVAWQGLKLSTKHPIFDQTVGRYERDGFIKVWWTDDHNVLRGINIMDPPDNVSDVDIVGDVNLTHPIITAIGTGNIPVGAVQYAYQLYNLGGSETIFSAVSPLYSLTTKGIHATDTTNFKGSPSRDEADARIDSGKSVTIRITDPDTDFDRIRLVAIHYDTVDSTPAIDIVTQMPFAGTVDIIDSGSYTIGIFTIEEFRTLGGDVFTCKTITEKDNMLFAGNISYDLFDIDFDARAYRFRNGQSAFVYNTSGVGTTVTMQGAWPNRLMRINGSVIEEDEDLICPYNYNPNYATEALPANREIIPETAPYDDSNDWAAVFQADETTRGGEGENVKFEFITEIKKIALGKTTNHHRVLAPSDGNIGSYSNFANPSNAARYRGYKRDEIYRFGIVFFDNKGRQSYAKWIADIRMPALDDAGAGFANHWDNEIWCWNLGVKFTVDTTAALAINPDITGYQIVRIKRTESDKTIQFSGLMSATMLSNPTDGPGIFCPPVIPRQKYAGSEAGYNWKAQRNVCNIASPEVNYYKNQYSVGGDYVKIAGVMSERYFNHDGQAALWIDSGTQTHFTRFDYLIGDHREWDPEYLHQQYRRVWGIGTSHYQDVDNGLVSGPVSRQNTSANIIPFGTKEYVHFAQGDDNYRVNRRTRRNEAGTRYAVDFGVSYIEDTWLTADPWSVYYVDYKRKNITSIYGGPGYVARTTNAYIACGDFVPVSGFANVPGEPLHGTTTEVYGGDIFITQFAHLWTQNDNTEHMVAVEGGETGRVDTVNPAESFICFLTFPVETTVNTEYGHGMNGRNLDSVILSNKDWAPTSINIINEKAGTYKTAGFSDGYTPSGPPVEYTQDEDMYLYNSVYSQQNISKVFIARPADLIEVVKYDNLILRSNVKSNNEEIDSYLKFLANNSIEVDTSYGPINKLVRFRNHLMFFQDNGVGTISVNERQLVPVENNAALELGHGGVLDRFDMIATGIGAQTPESVIQTENAFYWVDMNKKSMYRYNGKAEDITVVKGMRSFMQNLPDIAGNRISADTEYIHLAQHSKRHEVYMIVNTTADEYMLVMNELTDAFTHLISVAANYYISTYDTLVSYVDYNDCHTWYESTNYNYFLFVDSPGVISYIINPNSNIVNTFHNWEISTEVYDSSDVPDHTKTLTNVRVRNDYQDSGSVDIIVGTNIRRRIRTWRMNIPRDNSARIRDTYMRADFTFDDSGDRDRLVLHDLITTYGIPAEMILK